MTGQQLKNSILQMAVQGKLVPQDPNDEPASVLLEKIRKEKERLIKEGKIKKEKNPSYIFRGADNLPYEKVGDNEPICIADEVPFAIPDTWEWVRFCNLVSFNIGKTPPRKEDVYWSSAQYPWVSIADMNADSTIVSTKEYVSQYAYDNTFKGKIAPKDTLLMSFKLTVGKVSLLEINAFHNEAIISIYPIVDINNIVRNYLFFTLPLLSQLGKTKTAIKGNTLNSESLNNLLIPLPPINEQHRIISCINELLPSVEKYSQLETELNALQDNFPDQLKKSILQEAIQGKLVPQDPNDEPASALLERIRAEKQKLTKEGKIKKDKHESVIFRRNNSYYEKLDGIERCIDNEIPFAIPDTWEWVRFCNLVSFNIGKTPPRKEDVYWSSAQYPWVSIADMNADSTIVSTKEYVSQYAYDNIFKGKIAPKDTLLMSFKLTVGKVSLLEINAFHNEAIISIYPIVDINNIVRNYLFFTLPLLSQLGETKTAIKGNTLNSKSLNNLLIPLPPLNEQHRICKKVEDVTSYIGNSKSTQ